MTYADPESVVGTRYGWIGEREAMASIRCGFAGVPACGWLRGPALA